MDPGSIPAIQDPDMLYAGITYWETHPVCTVGDF